MRCLVIIFCFIFLFSCNPNWGNYGGYKMDYDSAIKYYIVLDKGREITAADSKEEALKKGTILKFFRASGLIDSVLTGKEAYVIESFVDKNNIAFNDKFILLDQKPLSLIPGCGSSSKECKEALKKIDIHQYWIIDKSMDYIYGPLTGRQFLSKRKELKVPVKLKIKLNDVSI
jgi:hypothetical protein